MLLLRLVNAPGLLAVEGLEGGEAAPFGPEAATASRPVRPAQAEGPRPTFEKRPGRPDPPVETAAKAEVTGPGGDLWQAIRKNLEAKKKPLVVALLNQMQGTVEGGELVIACPHQMQLDRLREEDKWSVLLQAVEEAAGKKLPIRLVVSGGEKNPEADPVAETPHPQKKAFSDPMLAEVLREFEWATVLEVRAAPKRRPHPAVREEEEPEREEEPAAEETEAEEE